MSRWLDVGRVLLFAFLRAKTKLKTKEMQKKQKQKKNREQGLHPAILIEQAGQLRIHYFSKRFYLN